MEIIAAAAGVLIGAVIAGLAQEIRARSKLTRQEAEHREQNANLAGQLQQAQIAQDIIQSAKEQMAETFQAAAGQALRNNNEVFLTTAQENLGKTLETARGDFRERHQQFTDLVKPLTENYQKLGPQIESLTLQNQSLTTETAKLSSALTNNRQVGAWGEIQLQRVVELAGMTQYCDFVQQTTATGSLDRPDLTVRLPENRTIIIDAKASTQAYMQSQNQEDPGEREKSLEAHAGSLKGQVDDLAKKDYGSKVEGALDFVVMFIPGDQFLSAALAANPGLVEYAMAKRVAIATPASLISLLWAVANGWQRQRIAQDAEVIRKTGMEMHDRMMTFIGHYQNVGKNLDQAVRTYNQSVRSFDSRVAPQGRKFAELVMNDADKFLEPAEIQSTPETSKQAAMELPGPDALQLKHSTPPAN